MSSQGLFARPHQLASLACAALVYGAAVPALADDHKDGGKHLVQATESFIVTANPNPAAGCGPGQNQSCDLMVPAGTVVTDVELSMQFPARNMLLYVTDVPGNNVYVFQGFGSPGTSFAASDQGHGGIHLQSGIVAPAGGLRIGFYCAVGDQSTDPSVQDKCGGALMWSGYTQ